MRWNSVASQRAALSAPGCPVPRPSIASAASARVNDLMASTVMRRVNCRSTGDNPLAVPSPDCAAALPAQVSIATAVSLATARPTARTPPDKARAW
jgi:hypothetical protein